MKKMKKMAVALAISMGIGALNGNIPEADSLHGEGICYASIFPPFSKNDSLYGAEYGEVDGVDVKSKGVTINEASANATTGVEFIVKSGTWDKVYGAFSENENLTNNKVTINKDVEVNIGVWGAHGAKAANGNEIIVDGKIYGQGVWGGQGAIANNNEVTIPTNGMVMHIWGGEAYGNDSEVTANGNKVTLSTTTAGTVFGGDVSINENNTAVSANNNRVIIQKEGSVQNAYGGYLSGATEDATGNIAVNNNEVTISGIVTYNVYGGSALYMYRELAGVANNNKVTIDSGTVNNRVIVGMANMAENVQDNVLILGDKDNETNFATIGGNVFINAYGSYLDPVSAGGGTLNVYNSGNTIGGDLHADGANINFYIYPSDMNADGSKTMLDVKGIADVTNSTIKAGVRNLNDIKVAYGSKINLLKAGTLKADGATYEAIVSDGFIDRKLKLEQNDNTIIATATASDPPNPPTPSDPSNPSEPTNPTEPSKPSDTASVKSKSPMETQISSISIINTGSDLISNKSFADATRAIESNSSAGMTNTMAPFVSISGSSMRQKSGSYVDTRSWNIGVGFAKDVKNDNGKLMFGPIIEYGRGSYDSYLDDNTHATGDSSFLGIGAIIKQTNNDGLYYEGSLRIGQAKNDYKSSDVLPYSSISYDNSATYYAAHAGIGKITSLGKGNSLDYYGKLFYSHQNGNNVNINGVTGNSVSYNFSAIDSVRTKLGFRYNHDINPQNTIYAGLAWQHEFSGSARAIINSSDTSTSAPSPSLKGDTGIVEIGWKLNPTNDNDFEMDLGINGAFGKQQGFGGTANFIWHF